jgi:hypothetical protein
MRLSRPDVTVTPRCDFCRSSPDVTVEREVKLRARLQHLTSRPHLTCFLRSPFLKARHTSHATRHMAHVTHHTPHATCHMPHATRYIPHFYPPLATATSCFPKPALHSEKHTHMGAIRIFMFTNFHITLVSTCLPIEMFANVAREAVASSSLCLVQVEPGRFHFATARFLDGTNTN